MSFKVLDYSKDPPAEVTVETIRERSFPGVEFFVIDENETLYVGVLEDEGLLLHRPAGWQNLGAVFSHEEELERMRKERDGAYSALMKAGDNCQKVQAERDLARVKNAILESAILVAIDIGLEDGLPRLGLETAVAFADNLPPFRVSGPGVVFAAMEEAEHLRKTQKIIVRELAVANENIVGYGAIVKDLSRVVLRCRASHSHRTHFGRMICNVRSLAVDLAAALERAL